MAQIKICGITNEADAIYAADCGAAALGFIFYPHSPRYIEPERAKRIIEKLSDRVAVVGVFVNEAAEEVERICHLCRLDFIQFHGDETIRYCAAFPPEKVIKAVQLRNESDLHKALQYHAAAILADSRASGLYGGTGKKSNWELAARIKDKMPLILSGGLNENNIEDALKTVAPHALDFNSGIEIEPGRKDHKKMARIFKMIRKVASMQHETDIIFKKRKR